MTTTRSDAQIRPFRKGDLDEFLDLHATVFPGEHGRDWFAWKYEHNPYVDHVPMFVATVDGDLVGARPFMAFEMGVEGTSHLALQPGDAMVHPDHRRRGLFTRMTEAAIDRYEAGAPSFFFNFPNHRTLPGNLQLGWRTVGPVPTYYRIADPGALVAARTDSAPVRLVGRAATPVTAAYHRIRDRLAGSVDDLMVERRESVPATLLADLAGDVRGGIHAVRNERFYDWRFENPCWDYATYVATRGGDPVAAAVVGTGTDSGVVTTGVTDVVPGPKATPESALVALLRRIVDDHQTTELFAAAGSVPQSVLARLGFRGDDRLPLSRVTGQTTHVTRSLTGAWTVEGRDITDPANWAMTFAEQDTN